MWGKDHHWENHHQSERVGKGEEEEVGSFQLQEEADMLYPSQMEIYCVGFYLICFYNVYFFYVVSKDFWSKLIINVAINNHIILPIYEENIYIRDSS